MTLTAVGASSPRPSYEWISPTQAAARLGIGVRDVYRLIDQGRLAGYRIAGEVKLLACEVGARGTPGGGSEPAGAGPAGP